VVSERAAAVGSLPDGLSEVLELHLVRQVVGVGRLLQGQPLLLPGPSRTYLVDPLAERTRAT